MADQRCIDFSSAVEQLVKVHVREVNELRKQIYDFRSSLSSSRLGSPFLPERCAGLPHSLKLKAVSRPRTSSEKYHGLQKQLGTDSHRSRPRTPRQSVRLAELHKELKDGVANAVSPGGIAPEEASSGIFSKGASSDRSSSMPGSLNLKHNMVIVKRWQIMVDGILTKRVIHFVVRPGWALDTGEVPREEARRTRHACQMLEIGAFRNFSASTKELQVTKGGYAVRQILRKYTMRPMKSKSKSTQFAVASRFVMHPASPFRRFWVISCLSVILYEAFAITMAPFKILEGSGAKVIEWFSAIFWSTDVVINFFSGIYVNGSAEMRFDIVAKRYIQTWLLVDVSCASMQLVALLVDSKGLDATLFFRFLRLTRSVRVGRIFYWLREEWHLSGVAIAGGKIVQFMSALYVFVHCTACVLFEVGKTDDGWTHQYQDQLGSPSHNYFVSLHWSLSQLQGNVDIYPGTSTKGRLFAVVSSWCSILALTFFVSHVTDTLFDVRQQAKQSIAQERMVLSFLTRHDISSETRARIDFFLKQQKKEQTFCEDNALDEQTLAMFPLQLRRCLLSEMRGFVLTWHPTFAYLHKYRSNLLIDICCTALSVQTYQQNDDVFTAGEASNHAHLFSMGDFAFSSKMDVRSTVAPWLSNANPITAHSSGTPAKPPSDSPSSSLGQLESIIDSASNTGVPSVSSPQAYTSTRTSCAGQTVSSETSDIPMPYGSEMFQPSRPVQRVMNGCFVSEASLWMVWVHVGDLCAVQYGQGFSLGADALTSILGRHPGCHSVFSSYAKRFVGVAKQIYHTKTADLVELMGFQTVLSFEKGVEFQPQET